MLLLGERNREEDREIEEGGEEIERQGVRNVMPSAQYSYRSHGSFLLFYYHGISRMFFSYSLI
jgi:hypothetical protein